MIWPADDDGIIGTVVLPNEGGLVDNPDDPGGITNMGVTIAALSAFRGKPCTADDIRNLQRSEAIALYKQNYIARVGFDKITDVKVRTAVVDMAVLFGQTGSAIAVEQAALALEHVAGMPQDAIISDHDAEFINKAEPRALINALSVKRILHHADVVAAHPNRLQFLRGWDARACAFVQ